MRLRSFRCDVLMIAVLVFFCDLSIFAGEPQWIEIRSPHFSVVTDAGEKRGREVAMRFEQMRAVFGALMTKANVNLPIPLQIVAFRNGKELRQFAPLFKGKPIELAGLFQGGADRSFILLDMGAENPWTIVFHEYAHQLMNGNLQGQFDPWFQEGFAEYFSSIEVDNKEARVGRIPQDEYTILAQLGMMKIADLFKVQQNSQTYNESGDHRSTFYAESGIVMHYIYDNQLLPKVAMYFDLEENKHLRVEDAIQQAFGMSPRQFDNALADYVRVGRYRYFPIPNPPSIAPNTYSSTAMSTGNANAVLADVHLHSRDYQDRAMSEFQDVLKSEPNNAAASRGLGYAYLEKQDYTQAAEYFKRASQLDSKDPRVHYYIALLMARENGFVAGGGDGPAMKQELETSIALDPDFADSYALLAFAQSGAGDPAKALVTMRKAIDISPRNESYLYNLAELYLANRQPDLAILLLQSLRGTDNPVLASQVATGLAQAVRFKQMLQTGGSGPASGTVSVRKLDGANNEHGNVPDSSPATSPSLHMNAGPAKFLRGTLNQVDCSTDPSAVLTIVSGAQTLKMQVEDKRHVVLIGADQFSCSWTKQKVAVNYRVSDVGKMNVISLEIQ